MDDEQHREQGTHPPAPPSRQAPLQKIREMGQGIWEWIWKKPEPGGFWAAKTLRGILRITCIVTREFRKDAVTLRASALTYAIILSLIPMLALGTAVLKGLGAGDQMRQITYQMIQRMEKMEKSDHQPPSLKGEFPVPAEKQKTLASHLKIAADKVFDYVDHTNFAAIGAFGILGLLLTVISIFSKIEQAMNAIWTTPRGRPLGRKVMDYLALMILFPAAVNLGLAAMAALQSPKLLSAVQRIIPLPLMWTLLLNLLPMAVIVATFTILYRFLPNTKVAFKNALAGGLAGGIGWIVVQALYMKLQIGVARYNAIYGSFATIPLFLLWVYLGWVVFLGGAEVSYASQVWRTYVPRKETLSPKFSLALAFDLLEHLYKEFTKRNTPKISDLAQQMGQSEGAVVPLLEKLTRSGLIREIKEGEGLVPAAPAGEVHACEIIDVIYGQEVPSTKGGDWANKGIAAMKQSFSSLRLSSILKEDTPTYTQPEEGEKGAKEI